MYLQKDADGNVIQSFKTLLEIKDKLGIFPSRISEAIKNKWKSHGCFWEKVDDNHDEVDKPEINGVKPEHHVDFENEILPFMVKVGKRAMEKNEKEKNASISIRGSQPFAIAIMSDVHGGGKTDYEAIKNDVDIIRETEDMWAILAGDLTDNFIIGKLQSIQKEQPLPLNYEQRFVKWFLDALKSSLIAFVSGNHDNWTKKVAAFDVLRSILDGVDCLFDSNQVMFNLNYFGQTQRWLVRHKFKHNSIFNPTHGIEVAWERMGMDFDVAIAGHTHIATLHRPFIKHDKLRHAILLGTYKVRDEFATEIGFAKSYGRGSGALVYHPDGRNPLWCPDLKTARDILMLYKMQIS